MKKISFISRILIGGLSLAGFALLNPVASAQSHGNGNNNPHNKVTICHATGSQSNPYVRITLNANGVVSGHHGHQDGRDIIPPFTYNDHGTTRNYPGQNWDTAGQAIWNNGCRVPHTTPTQGGNGGGGGNHGGGTVGGVTTHAGGRGAGSVLGAQVEAPVGGVASGYGASEGLNIGSAVGFAGALALAGYGLRRLMQVE